MYMFCWETQYYISIHGIQHISMMHSVHVTIYIILYYAPDGRLYFVVASVILYFTTVQYNGWCYMQGTPAVLYAGYVKISVRTVLNGMVLSKLLFWSKSFFLFYIFYWPASTTYWYCASPPPWFPNRSRPPIPPTPRLVSTQQQPTNQPLRPEYSAARTPLHAAALRR